ncbi:hypothetical protein PMCNE_05850 [Pasteurella multocida]|uniref:DUF2167 domain-containing protein n=1 Tax=Pasteurella multocida TaxID=747 RepID=UPI0007EDB303|nr:DUF2167 domain-containing protein [Pasteurella multocida]MCL7796790.1 DUF2167 domain-containing protein [Pasteurella multocida]MCL7800601.1 DUF2167 domain-containing protein [Pasteurella multocida]MCL7822328.1 DUF2167 domain-containing protein [Pasteurella multocida]MDG2540633.1 DUF2167 domain-containing protein [Pasteurella multocida]OBP35579.1 hypothetical protein A0R74_00805 [Pasteurella multocida subsp. multocida]
MKILIKLTALLLLGLSWHVNAENSAEEDWLYEQLFSQAIEGPATIPLADQATFALPAGMIFLPAEEANQYMELIGNNQILGRLGIVMDDNEDSEWIADILFDDVGYVSDKEARKWDAQALFTALREGDEEQNKIRRERGIAEIEMVDWIQKPTYDEKNNRLIWAVNLKEVGPYANPELDNTINYNTYVLGREGYIELGFITGEDRIKAEQHIAQDLLSRIRFNTGKRYADFDPATDAVYEHGLTSLIGGITLATKLGLFAVITAFVAKFWKLLVVALLVLGFVLKGLWRNKAKKEANKQIVE